MSKKYLMILYTLPVFCLVLWTGYLYYQQNTGRSVIVSITGYDPRDVLSGHYIQYTIDWNATDCTQFENNVCPQDEFCKEAKWGKQCRFYVPENKAQKLDELFRHRGEKDAVFQVVYSYKKGRTPMATNLLINGKDWFEVVD